MRRSTFLALTMLSGLVLVPGSALAQTAAERCLTMRLALLGSTLKNSLACHAWSVATRTPASEACVAHGEQQLAAELRARGCASEDEILDLVERSRDATALLVDSQLSASRLAEYETTQWRTEVIVDLVNSYRPGIPWPDLSCRATGYCASLMIFVCGSTAHPDGSVDTSCNTVPESSGQSSGVPVITTENTSLPTGEILSRGSSPQYEVVISMAPDGSSFTGSGFVGTTPLFLTGQRAE
jgi:hypothetical protein